MQESEKKALRALREIPDDELRERLPILLEGTLEAPFANDFLPTCDEMAEEIRRRVPRLFDICIHCDFSTNQWHIQIAAWASDDNDKISFIKAGPCEQLSEVLCRALIAAVSQSQNEGGKNG